MESKTKSVENSEIKELVKILRSFNASNINTEISTFLKFFEHQVSRVNIERKDFAIYFLGLHPFEITQMVRRVQKDFENDY